MSDHSHLGWDGKSKNPFRTAFKVKEKKEIQNQKLVILSRQSGLLKKNGTWEEQVNYFRFGGDSRTQQIKEGQPLYIIGH